MSCTSLLYTKNETIKAKVKLHGLLPFKKVPLSQNTEQQLADTLCLLCLHRVSPFKHSHIAGIFGDCIQYCQALLSGYGVYNVPDAVLGIQDAEMKRLDQCHHLFCSIMAALQPLVKVKVVQKRTKKFTRHQSD